MIRNVCTFSNNLKCKLKTLNMCLEKSKLYRKYYLYIYIYAICMCSCPRAKYKKWSIIPPCINRAFVTLNVHWKQVMEQSAASLVNPLTKMRTDFGCSLSSSPFATSCYVHGSHFIWKGPSAVQMPRQGSRLVSSGYPAFLGKTPPCSSHPLFKLVRSK